MRAHPRHSPGLPVLLTCLLLGSCDLLHADQKAFCFRARNDPPLCASRPDWCMPYGGASCRPADNATGYCGSCQPGPDQRSCQAVDAQRNECRFHTPRLGGDGVLVIQHSGQMNGLDATLLGPWIGKPLPRELVERLDDKQRRVICGVGRGLDWQGASYCRLEWDATQDEAVCRFDESYCGRCRVQVEPFQCLSKNLCSGVICP